MNLRLSKSQIRFRILQDEFAILISKGSMETCIDLGDQSFRYRVVVCENDTPITFSIQQETWLLGVDRKALLQLAESLPSREGIKYTVQLGASPIALVLEVDVRNKH